MVALACNEISLSQEISSFEHCTLYQELILHICPKINNESHAFYLIITYLDAQRIDVGIKHDEIKGGDIVIGIEGALIVDAVLGHGKCNLTNIGVKGRMHKLNGNICKWCPSGKPCTVSFGLKTLLL